MSKKFFLIVLCLCLCLMIASLAVYATSDGNTTICRWYGNKSAAYSITYDDGISNSLTKFENLQKTYNLVGTAALISNWIDNGVNIDGYSIANWSYYKDMASRGIINVCSHTNTHPDLTTKTVSQIDDELNTSKQSIINNIGTSCDALVYPYYSYNNTVKTEAAKYYICAAQAGDNDGNPYNTTDYYGLYRYTPYSNTTVTQLNDKINSAISKGNWFILCSHGCDGEGWESQPLSFFDNHYKFINSKLGSIWNDYYDHVAKYLRERNSSTVEVKSVTASEIKVNITNSLDSSVYNHPLTAKTKVPSTWTTACVVQGTTSKNITTILESNERFVYYDIIPNKGEISITQVGSSPSITNLALNKLASASSTYGKGYEASKANDGNSSTRWLAKNRIFPVTWTVDLGAQYSLSGIDLELYTSDKWKYSVSVSSDNKNFTTVVDKTKNTSVAKQYKDSITTTARYVRVIFTGCSQQNKPGISEIIVSGK